MIDTLLQELRFAIRMLLKKPVFSAVAIATLALGIGANTAIFSLVDAVLFRQLPVRDPARLVRIFASDEHGKDLSNSSYPVFTDYRDQAKSFSGIAAYSNWNFVDLSIDGQKPERVRANLVSGNYFDLLGLLPAAGRLLSAGDDAHQDPVIVLSHRFWKQRFAGDPRTVGLRVLINGNPFTVIGVTRPEFYGASLDGLPDFWMPITMLDQAQPEWAGSMKERRMSWVDIVGRLNAGVTLEQAQAELRAIAAARAAAQAEKEKDPSATLMTARDAATQWDLLPTASMVSWVLFGMVLLVLLISCAVTAGLFLVRAEQRHREIVIRLAIGAPRTRILRQLLVESLLLSGLAAIAGLFLAAWITDLLIALSPSEFPLSLDAASSIVDPRVLLFTTGLSFAAALLFGLSPAIRASRFNLMDGLKQQATFLKSARLPLQSMFVIAQIALSAILLAGAGLLLRTLWIANAVNPGFNPGSAVAASLDLAKEGYTRETGAAFYDRLLQEVRLLPHVRSVSLAKTVPVQNSGMRISVEVDGTHPKDPGDNHVELNVIAPGYFTALGVALQQGRDFQTSDRETAPGVAIINRTMAEQFWPGQNPVGKIIKDVGPDNKDVEIVGVAGDVRYRSLREPAAPMLYMPLGQFYLPSMTLLVRTEDDSDSIVAALTTTVSNLDNHLPLFKITTLRQKLGASLSQERVVAGLLCAFGLLALILASTGLYTVVSYATQLRTREFGVRMALGAGRRDVLSLVLLRGMLLTATGLVVGMACALALGRLVTSLLFGVTATDPPTFAGIVVLMGALSLLACYIPALRATRINPTDALRYE